MTSSIFLLIARPAIAPKIPHKIMPNKSKWETLNCSNHRCPKTYNKKYCIHKKHTFTPLLKYYLSFFTIPRKEILVNIG